MQNLSPEVLAKALAGWRKYPALFFRDVLGVTLEPYQEKILHAIANNERVAISACHDVGKSFTLARVVLWFGICFPKCKIITTAPTGRQVRAILWSEIRSAYARSLVPLGGRMLTQEWQIDEHGDWFAIGFSPSNEAARTTEGQGTQSSFQGFHAEGGILVIFDEATGVKKPVWTMAEGLLTQDNVKFVAIGNPTSTQSEFYKCFSDRSWAKVKLSCFDSPNLIANGITDMAALVRELDYCRTLNDNEFLARMRSYVSPKPYLLTPKWVIAQTLKWGLQHPLTLSKILGEFPEEGDNVLFPLRMVEEAQEREYIPQPNDERLMGIDVARFGSDSTVLTYIHGYKVLAKKALFKRDTNVVCGEAIRMAQDLGMPDIITVDETGLGGGVVDVLTERSSEGKGLSEKVRVRGVQFGEAPEGEEDAERYVNKKARMYDLLAQDLRSNIALLSEDVYLEELPLVVYTYDSKGRMKIESKDEFKKRTGRGSPDHLDSLALANYGRYDEIPVGSFNSMTQVGSAAQPRRRKGGLRGGVRY